MREHETKILENSPLLRRVLESQERVEILVKTLEESIERQGYNTVPMWEQALRELGDIKQSVAMLSRKMDVFTLDVMNLRQEQLHNEQRLARVEAENEGGGMVRIN